MPHEEGEGIISVEEMLSLAPPLVAEDFGGDWTAVAYSEADPFAGFWATGNNDREAGGNAHELAQKYFQRLLRNKSEEEYLQAMSAISIVAFRDRVGPFASLLRKAFSWALPKDEFSYRQKWERIPEAPFEPTFREQRPVEGAGRWFDIESIIGSLTRLQEDWRKKPLQEHQTRMFVLDDISPPTTSLKELSINVSNYFGISRHELEDLSEEERLEFLADTVSEAVSELNKSIPSGMPGYIDAAYDRQGALELLYIEENS